MKAGKVIGISIGAIGTVVGGWFLLDYFVFKDESGKTKYQTKKDAKDADTFQEQHHDSQANTGGYTPPPPVNSTFPLSTGARGTLVQSMQQGLMKMGISMGKYGADGIFGNDTLSGLKQAGYNSPVSQADYNNILAGIKKTQSTTPSSSSGSGATNPIGKVPYANEDGVPVYRSNWTAYKTAKKGESIGVSITGTSGNFYKVKGFNGDTLLVGKDFVYF